MIKTILKLFIIIFLFNCSPYFNHYYKGKIINSVTKEIITDVKVEYEFSPVKNEGIVYSNNNGEFEIEEGLRDSNYDGVKLMISKNNFLSKEIISDNSEWQKKNDSELLKTNYEYDFGSIELDSTSDIVE